VPAGQLAVVKDGKIIKAEGYGLANVELNVPSRPETVFKIGSVSKQFISAGILLLIQEGKMSLDDSISKFLDGTPDACRADCSRPRCGVQGRPKVSSFGEARVTGHA
jgi:CubicO group peptidase (beta-lactamase class C family)